MRNTKLIHLIIVPIIGLVLLSVPQFSSGQAFAQGDGRTILPGQGVTFQQVDFTFPKARMPDSDWGRVSVNANELFRSTGVSSGYINIFTHAGWVVDNLFVNVKGPSQVATYFTLGLTGDVTLLSAHVVFSPSPQSSFADGQRSDFPVGNVGWNAQGAGEEDVTTIPSPPPPKEGGLIEAPELSRANRMTAAESQAMDQHFQSDTENVQCAINQCVPCSVSNSLQFLENSRGIVIPHDHVFGLRGDNSLVGQLDETMDRPAQSRTQGEGLRVPATLQGKFEYLVENSLQNDLIHRHQGRGFGAPDGDFQHMGITSEDNGATVTWDFICNELKAGADVELFFAYDNGGGHAVRVVGCGITANDRWIQYAHDRNQSNDGDGLEAVKAIVQDLDDDGTLNLASASQEIVFVLSQRSRAEAVCSTLGNDPRPSLLDQDIFTFAGTAGEQVTVRVDQAPAGAHTGERVTLILSDTIAGAFLVQIDNSALPNEITATLPATGAYQIIIAEQAQLAPGQRFRGDYCVTLGSSGGASQTLAPTVWIE